MTYNGFVSLIFVPLKAKNRRHFVSTCEDVQSHRSSHVESVSVLQINLQCDIKTQQAYDRNVLLLTLCLHAAVCSRLPKHTDATHVCVLFIQLTVASVVELVIGNTRMFRGFLVLAVTWCIK